MSTPSASRTSSAPSSPSSPNVSRTSGRWSALRGLHTGIIRAVVRKELRDYRRNRFIVATMATMPIAFLIVPVIIIFNVPATAQPSTIDTLVGLALFYLLLIPALIPAVISAHTVVGEREQGTLEPVLTTPARREELLLGKAAAALVPTLLTAYLLFGLFLVAVALFAHQNVATDVFKPSRIVPQVVFTPLLATWSIWVGIAISTKASDVRVAQQLGSLASLPPLGVTALFNFGVLRPTPGLAVGLGAALLVIDSFAWRLVSRMFDRERLITGLKP
jgi:ABC-type Na+ efflux pump permease subunit